MSEDNYLKSAWATEYHNNPFEELLGAGSAGPGKTSVLIRDPVPQIGVEHLRCQFAKNPDKLQASLTAMGIPEIIPGDPKLGIPEVNCRDLGQDWGQSTGWALHLRRTVKNLAQSIERTKRIFPKIDPNVHWDESATTWTFASGFKFQFGHCKDRNSWMDWMSSEYTHLAFDELITFNEEQYRQISTRVRSSDRILQLLLKTRSMSNPTMTMDAEDSYAVDDPHWVRKYFIDDAPEGRTVLWREIDMEDGTFEKVRRMYLPATIDDNPDKAFVRQYKVKLASQPKHIREALLKGNWYYTPGSYYGEQWNERLHTCMPFRIPPEWPIFRSMDWGFKHHGCIHWWTLDDEDNLYCIRELTFIEKRDEEVARIVRQTEEMMGVWRGGKSGITGPADTQLWEQRGAVGRSMAQNFARKGVPWVKCDKGKTRQGNAERLLGRLKDHREGTVTPGIVFFRNLCPNAIRTIPMILTDPKQTWMPLDGGDDHWHDSCLYACQYASKGRKGIAKMRRAREPWEEDDAQRPSVSGGNYGSNA